MSKQEALSKEEFSVIYLAHYDAMKRYAARAFYAAGRPDPQRVQDAVQETFRILWEKPASYRNSPSPDGWLYVTLSNTIKNQLRQDNRQAKLLLKVQAAWPEEVHPAPGADLELEGFVPQEDLELLKRVYLHKEGLENIAQDLGTTRTALAKRVSRIKEKFRKNYRESEKNLDPEKNLAQDREKTPLAGHELLKGGTKR